MLLRRAAALRHLVPGPRRCCWGLARGSSSFSTLTSSSSSTSLPHSGFLELGLSSPLADALQTSMDIDAPTGIQRRAIPAALPAASDQLNAIGGDVLIAAQTGTGKTLAYLLPIVQSLKAAEAAWEARQAAGGASGKREAALHRPQRPRSLILAPSKELAEQCASVAKQLAHHVKLRVRVATASVRRNRSTRDLASPVDILVGTPGRIEHMVRNKEIWLSQVQHVAIDEADTMYDMNAGFAPVLRRLLAPLRPPSMRVVAKLQSSAARERRTSRQVQFLLATASLKPSSRRLLEVEYPNAQYVSDDGLHTTHEQLKQVFVQSAGRDKLDLLVDTLLPPARVLQAMKDRVEHHDTLVPPTIVFCNTVASCRAIDHTLNERGFRTACYHGDIPLAQRTANYESFVRGERTILVATDIASRGLDTTFVEHVVLFDFPLNPIDYLHRVGRTARAGTDGRVTSFVQKRDRVLASAIEEALASGTTLESLSSSVAPAHNTARRHQRSATTDKRKMFGRQSQNRKRRPTKKK